MGRNNTRLFDSLAGRGPVWEEFVKNHTPAGRATWSEFERTQPGGLFTRQNSSPTGVTGVKIPRQWNEYSAIGKDGFVLQHVQQFYTRTFTSTVTRSLNFFDAPLDNDSLYSNVYPYPNSVLWKAIGIYFNIAPSLTSMGGSPTDTWPSRLNDLMQIVNNGILKINLSKRNWGPFKLWSLNSGGGLWGMLTGGSTPNGVNYANVGFPSVEAAFRLIVPFVIPATSQAKIQMEWPATLTLANGNPEIVLKIEGVEANPTT